MRKYNGCNYRGIRIGECKVKINYSYNAPNMTMKGDNSIFRGCGKVDLFLDESTFNILVVPSEKGRLKVRRFKYPNGKLASFRFIVLTGFLRQNDLEKEEFEGIYRVEKTEKGFVVIRSSRTKFEYEKLDRHKFSIATNRHFYDIWCKVKGNSTTMSSFVVEAVNSHIRDYYPEFADEI